MEESSKKLGTKNHVETAFDSGDKNREKNQILI